MVGKIANTIFENMLIDKLSDGKISAEFIEKTAQIFNLSEDYLKEQIEIYLTTFINSGDAWIYEVCWKCSEEKLVHIDMSSSYDNPTFICRKCEGLNQLSLIDEHHSSLRVCKECANIKSVHDINICKDCSSKCDAYDFDD